MKPLLSEITFWAGAQNEYALGHLKVEEVTQSRKVIADLLARYRARGDSKNIVHVVHQVPSVTPVFTPDTILAREFDELSPNPGEKVVIKQFPNSFAQTDLHGYLGGLGKVGKKIVLVGYMAHVCVSTTIRAASELGYEAVIVEDAVGDRNIPGATASTLKSTVLSELDDGFGTVITAAEIS